MLSWLRKLSRASRPSASEQAQALHRQGKIENLAGRHREAASLLIAAIDANPGVAEFHYELGQAMRGLGEPARAVTCFRKAIAIEPAHLDAHIDIASIMLALGNVDGAEQAARSALSFGPQSLAAHVNLGAALEGQKRFSEAADRYRAALAIDADCVAALANLSAVCLQLGAIDEARRCTERALRIAPHNPDAHVRHGNVLMEQRQLAQAAESFGAGLRLRPGDAATCISLGFAYDLQGRFESAMGCYEKALGFDPGNVAAHLNRAAIWLLEEDYARGWEEYEWRLRSKEHAPLYERFQHPRWDGSSLAGRRILVYAEQGLGDEIMYASCLPDVIAQAAHCVIDCEPRLAGLMRRSFPQAAVHGGRQTDTVDWLEDAGPIDIRVPAGSLPLTLRREPAQFPQHKGYLRAAPERVAAWRARLQGLGPGLKIGLSWRGGVPQTGRGMRSISLPELLPVLRLGGATFVSLQYGQCGEELALLRERYGVEIHHWQEAIDDYEETAALVCGLDVVLSVCTAVVDLGGALGRPVWVMAPVRTDFRYGFKGKAMRWYPSARIFRQTQCGEWDSVTKEVAAALSQISV